MLVYRRISPCFMMYPYYITIFTILYNSHDIPIYQASWAKLHEGAGSKSNSTKAGDLLGDPSRFQETTWIYIRFTYCSWFMVDLWLIYGWFMVDLWLIYGWFVVDLWLIYGWFVVDLWLIYGWFVVDLWLICGWFMVDLWLICGWFMVDLWLICGWFMVDLWLIYGWFMVDLWLIWV